MTDLEYPYDFLPWSGSINSKLTHYPPPNQLAPPDAAVLSFQVHQEQG